MSPLFPKRRILYIRHTRTRDLTEGFRMNQDEWFETLSSLADVTLINEVFDMDEVCTQLQPDFILYESPYFYSAPLLVANPKSHPHIPRLGLLIQDPYCATRVNFLRALELLDIKWLFTHMTETALRQSPELKTRTFSLSLLFDDTIFRDYQLTKDIPVSVFGGFLLPEIYNWRAKTARDLTHFFPTLLYTHPGYQKPVPPHKFAVEGEAYARLLNRSHFSLADSTYFDCLVRKHLEIPASGALLIAPDAPVLGPYGFRDMENCILGEGQELFEKIAHVADAPEAYERIRKKGYELVHSRYSRRHWRGILDFYECLRALKPGETIRQQGILGPFEIVPDPQGLTPAITGAIPESDISRFFQKWLTRLTQAEAFETSDPDILKMPEWIGHMLEPLMFLGIMALLKGGLAQAQIYFLKPQQIRHQQSGYSEYDPEEIAWLSLTAALSGNQELLQLTRRKAATMRHMSLRRVQWLGQILASDGHTSRPPESLHVPLADDQLSTHWTGQLAFKDWLTLIKRILAANGQGGLLH